MLLDFVWATWAGQATKLLLDIGEKRLPLAEVVLRCMRKTSIEVNVLHGNVAAGACLQCNMWQHALDVTSELATHYTEGDITSVSTRVRACMQRGHWPLALSDMKTMQNMKAGIGRYTKAVLAPSKSANAWDVALWFHFWLANFRLDPDPVSTAEVLSSCKGDRGWQHAVEVHEGISFPPRDLNLNTYLDALCIGGQWCASYDLFLQMPGLRVMPDLVTANTVVNAAPWKLAWITFSESLGVHFIFHSVVSFTSLSPSMKCLKLDESSMKSA